MSLNISSNNVFVLFTLDTEGTRDASCDTLVQGLVVTEDTSHPKGVWGTAAWFDKVSAIMHMVAIESAPSFDGNRYLVRDTDGTQYSFQLMTKPVYDSVVRKLLPFAPTLHNNQEIQDYIRNLNPYE